MTLEARATPLQAAVTAEHEDARQTVDALILRLLAALDERQIDYCLLRDGDHLDELFASDEIDLLVQKKHLAALQAAVARLGFVGLRSWGHAPHHFFLKYDKGADRWLKLDVVTDLYFGRPVRALRTDLAAFCLKRRRRHGPPYLPSAEDEFIALLLHCVMDKGRFDPARRRRLQELAREIKDPQYLSSLLAAYWTPDMSRIHLFEHIEDGDWDALLAQDKRVVAHIAQRDPRGTAARRIWARLWRKAGRWVDFFRPRVPMVALLAPDGAGKSTLAAGLEASSYFSVCPIYMGLYQKSKGRSKRAGLPGLGFAGHILKQWRRYLKARYQQGRGRLVIFDRYTYDALLSTRQDLDVLRRFRRWVLANVCPDPDLVIILDAPGELLYSRKGEHSVALLEDQREQYLQLRPQLPHAVVIDASQDSDTVRREAMALIWRKFSGQAQGRGGIS